MALRAQSDINISGGGIGLKSSGILAQSAVAASVTGTLTETVLATIPIPAGAMGVNGALRITSYWSMTNSANSKTYRVKLGAQNIRSLAFASTSGWGDQFELVNRGLANSQFSAMGNSANSYGTFTGTFLTATVDTTVAQNLTLTATLTNVGETITLEAYTVELLNP